MDLIKNILYVCTKTSIKSRSLSVKVTVTQIYHNRLHVEKKRNKTLNHPKEWAKQKKQVKNCENIQNAHGKVVVAMVTGSQFSLGIQSFME